MAAIKRSIERSYLYCTTEVYTERLCASWLLPTWGLFAWRTLVSVYAFTVLFTEMGYQDTHGEVVGTRQSFSYFTILGYWGIAFYFAFTAAHTGSRAFRGYSFLSSWPGWLKWLHSVFYATVTVFPFIVTIVYWSLLSSGAFDTTYSTWDNISHHILNSFFAFSEIVLPRSLPHPWLNLAPLIVILALYLGLAYLTYDTEHFYVYSFLNPDNGRGLVAGVCVGILVAAVIAFVIVKYLILFRTWVTEKKLGMDGDSPAARESRLATTEIAMAEKDQV